MKQYYKALIGQIMHNRRLIIIFIVGVALFMLPPGKKETKSHEENKTAANHYKKTTEQNLEQLLSAVDGVGKCRVMITFEDGGENLYAKDKTMDSSVRGEEKSDREAHTYIKQTQSGGVQSPVPVKTANPTVSGVLIVADGGGDQHKKNEITSAVCAVLRITPNRVAVLKRKR